MTEYKFHCYMCGTPISLKINVPTAPEFIVESLYCKKCKNKTSVLMSKCPKLRCETVLFWIQDYPLSTFFKSVAQYYQHHIQLIIDQAARQDIMINTDLKDHFPLSARCTCGTEFTVKLPS